MFPLFSPTREVNSEVNSWMHLQGGDFNSRGSIAPSCAIKYVRAVPRLIPECGCLGDLMIWDQNCASLHVRGDNIFLFNKELVLSGSWDVTNIRLLSYLEDLTMNISGLDIIYDYAGCIQPYKSRCISFYYVLLAVCIFNIYSLNSTQSYGLWFVSFICLSRTFPPTTPYRPPCLHKGI